jgi:chromosomal replication initiator protein
MVLKGTAKYFGMTVKELISDGRTEDLVYPRQIAMYLANTVVKASTPRIGYYMGNRDHTTVIHGIRKIKGRLAAGDGELQKDVERIKSWLDQVLTEPVKVA